LRVELDLDLALEELAGELLVLADVGADHLPDLAAVEQLAEPPAVDAAIVADHGEALDAALDDGVDQVLGDAAQAEAAGDDGHVVVQEAGERRRRIRMDFLHQSPPEVARALRRATPRQKTKTAVGSCCRPLFAARRAHWAYLQLHSRPDCRALSRAAIS
jgi:hypothetical protein